jgi:hypothetical protein
MFKTLAAALILSTSIEAAATSLIPQVSVLQCRSVQQFNDFGYQVELFRLPTRPEGKSHMLVVTMDSIMGAQVTRELAVEKANPRMGGPMHYIARTYALAANFTGTPSPYMTAVLKTRGGEHELVCVTSIRR